MIFTDALLHHHFNEISLGFKYLEQYKKTHYFEGIADKEKNIITGVFLNVIISGFSLIENYIRMLGRDFFYYEASSKRNKPILFDENEKFILHGLRLSKEQLFCKKINDICDKKHKKYRELKIEEMLTEIPKFIYKKIGKEQDFNELSSTFTLQEKMENFLVYRKVRNLIIHGGYDMEIEKYYDGEKLKETEYHESLRKKIAYSIETVESVLENGAYQKIIISEFILSELSEIAFSCSVSCIELCIAIHAIISKVFLSANFIFNLEDENCNYIDIASIYCNERPSMYAEKIKRHYNGHKRLFILDNWFSNP